ncbi:hypothetical protein [Pyrodictium abyssi]|uniref:Uncharacterized protein n=1 Tax=Pyrodictium abyssi TaxID=54256 RepID=A0ABM8IWK0_9CREN|nr:hypothetical protein PABY_15030 [Pyrodictium abyssi]
MPWSGCRNITVVDEEDSDGDWALVEVCSDRGSGGNAMNATIYSLGFTSTSGTWYLLEPVRTGNINISGILRVDNTVVWKEAADDSYSEVKAVLSLWKPSAVVILDAEDIVEIEHGCDKGVFLDKNG